MTPSEKSALKECFTLVKKRLNILSLTYDDSPDNSGLEMVFKSLKNTENNSNFFEVSEQGAKMYLKFIRNFANDIECSQTSQLSR